MVPSIQTSVLYVVAIFAAFFIGLYLYVTRNFNFWKKLGVPYIKPTPFFGNLKETVLQKRCIGEHFRKIYEEQKGKPYVGVFSFDQPSLVIRNLDTVKNILVKDAQYFIDHTMTFDEELEPMFGKSLFSINGQRWRHVRTNLSPVFTSGKMKKVFNLVENCGKELIHYLDRASSDGECYTSLQECKVPDF
jgi:cytochrome P450 family 6